MSHYSYCAVTLYHIFWQSSKSTSTHSRCHHQITCHLLFQMLLLACPHDHIISPFKLSPHFCLIVSRHHILTLFHLVSANCATWYILILSPSVRSKPIHFKQPISTSYHSYHIHRSYISYIHNKSIFILYHTTAEQTILHPNRSPFFFRTHNRHMLHVMISYYTLAHTKYHNFNPPTQPQSLTSSNRLPLYHTALHCNHHYDYNDMNRWGRGGDTVSFSPCHILYMHNFI